MEISEDKRLRESGIDPDGDPIDIMYEVRLRYERARKQQGLDGAEKKMIPLISHQDQASNRAS